MDSNLTNIQEYYDSVKDQYNIDFEDFKEICLTPFKFIKKVMSSGVLKNIRYQYLGVFEVSKSRVHYSKKMLAKSLEKGNVSEERYNRRMKILNSYEE